MLSSFRDLKGIYTFPSFWRTFSMNSIQHFLLIFVRPIYPLPTLYLVLLPSRPFLYILLYHMTPLKFIKFIPTSCFKYTFFIEKKRLQEEITISFL